MAQRELKFDEWCAMWQCALERISAREAEFSELDAALGDGDHGQAIVGAMKVVVDKLSAGANFRSALGDAGMEVLMAISGSTSTLLGALLLGMSDGVGAVDVIGAKDFKSMFGWGLKNVQQQTRAMVGDKTMMDALIPATEAIAAYAGDSEAELFTQAAAAAAAAARCFFSWCFLPPRCPLRRRFLFSPPEAWLPCAFCAGAVLLLSSILFPFSPRLGNVYHSEQIALLRHSRNGQAYVCVCTQAICCFTHTVTEREKRRGGKSICQRRCFLAVGEKAKRCIFCLFGE